MKFFLLIVVIAHSSLCSATDIVFSVAGSESSAKSRSQESGAQIGQSSARIFANGNTFINLEHSVYSASVEVALPQTLNSENLMEALLLVRTLRSNGAGEVSIFVNGSTSKLKLVDSQKKAIPLDIIELFSTAGANTVRSKNEKSRRLTDRKFRPRPRPGDHVGFAVGSSELATKVTRKLNTKLYKNLNPINFRDRSTLLFSASSSKVNENFFKTLSASQRIAASGSYVHLVTPYLPYARSDKIDQKGVTVGGRLIADLIEISNHEVTFVRAHAPQSQGFFSIPSTNLSGRPTVNKLLAERGIQAVISPDAGFQKDASLYADELGVQINVANKQRNPKTSESILKGFSGPSLKGKRVVIIDDETASGGTLSEVAKEARRRGAAFVLAVVTHITGSASKAIDSPYIDEIVVTDSLPLEKEGVTRISIAEELAQHLEERKPGAGRNECSRLEAITP